MKQILWIVLMLPGLAGATTYKCVDPGGNVTYSATPCGSDAQVMNFKDAPAEQGGEITLYIDENHSFRARGTVNGAPVMFVVDTGASRTAISLEVAQASGIKNCSGGGYAATANGMVRSCVALVNEIIIGQLHFRNLEVAVLPNMPVDALLGMDVLRQVKIQQENGVMHLSGK